MIVEDILRDKVTSKAVLLRHMLKHRDMLRVDVNFEFNSLGE